MSKKRERGDVEGNLNGRVMIIQKKTVRAIRSEKPKKGKSFAEVYRFLLSTRREGAQLCRHDYHLVVPRTSSHWQ